MKAATVTTSRATARAATLQIILVHVAQHVSESWLCTQLLAMLLNAHKKRRSWLLKGIIGPKWKGCVHLLRRKL